MPEIRWARGSQFNWVYDNMGGTPLMEILAGNWSGTQFSTAVAADGKVYIQTPLPGGGQVAYFRGVWKFETVFPWNGFWADPETGDLTNYYTGGSYANSGTLTTITLGTALTPGTVVQVYYLYYTGETGTKGQALNNTPCVRPAYRARGDYTYDFAVDRILDLMAVLAFAGPERGRDYSRLIDFLWNNFYPYQGSRTPPLHLDDFERQQWSIGAFLMYRDSNLGVQGYEKFAIELYPGDDDQEENETTAPAQGPRALRVILKPFSATTFNAWWGYGMNWDLSQNPLADISKVRFKLRGLAAANKVHNICKYPQGGSATLIVKGAYSGSTVLKYIIHIESGGEIGSATFKLSDDAGQTWKATGCKTGGPEAPVSLGNGLEVFWEPGAGNDFVAGDNWQFWAGEPEIHPRRLLVCLNDSAPGDADPWGPAHTFIHALPDRYNTLTQFEIDFSQFWRWDNIIHDGDRFQAMWGYWYSGGSPESSEIKILDLEEVLDFEGKTFYTQKKVTSNVTPDTSGWGVWIGIDTQHCNSAGQTQVNFLIKPVLAGANYVNLRVMVKDAQGSYFSKWVNMLQVNVWQRATVVLAEMTLESGTNPMTHPLQLIEISAPSYPPIDLGWYLADIKFGDHQVFSGERLRLFEFRYLEINQDLEQTPAWWMDETGVNLEAWDPYPYAPRQAISLTPYGQNSWRGPTLVHYAHALGPYLLNRLDLATNFLHLHRDAQDEFFNRYGGVKGPILPVHTRNDIENIALCGEEDFTRFSWWQKHRDFGLVSGAWPFNAALTDASGNGHTFWWSSGNPAYTTGICQPGNTAIAFDGSAHASLASNSLFEPGTDPFSLSMIIKGNAQAGDYLWVADKMGTDGWVVQTKTAGSLDLQLKVTTSGGDSYSDIPNVLDGSWHLITWMVDPANSKIWKIKDGVLLGEDALAVGNGLLNTAYLNLGSAAVFHLDYFKYERRVLPAAEYQETWDIVQGNLNGSSYPEVGHALGQYWAFYRLGQYFFATNDAAAWEILEQWLTWINTYGAADGPGWKLPVWFSEYGFAYGDYDPGAAASIALGCLYIYLRNGDATALTWARRVLGDLRANRQSGEFGGYVYKSDYHYAWLNALVAHAFGLAVTGRSGQVYAFPATTNDRYHFEAMLSRFFALSGDSKPNLLNADTIPFSMIEDTDVWDYVPHYLMLRQFGSMEALTLMLYAALDYAKQSGSWVWFDKMLKFVLLENLAVLAASSVRSITTSYELRDLKNLVRVRYGDYDRDNSKYAEAKSPALIDELGELPGDIDLQYGSLVITEDPQLAAILAERKLARLSPPREIADLETWLEGARLELGDPVAITSDFHGFDQEEFQLFAKNLSLDQRRVKLRLWRPIDYPAAWAVDDEGTAYDSYAIDQAGESDPNWSYRSYVY